MGHIDAGTKGVAETGDKDVAQVWLDHLNAVGQDKWSYCDHVYHAFTRLWYQTGNGGLQQYVDNGYWTGAGTRESGRELLSGFFGVAVERDGALGDLARIIFGCSEDLDALAAEMEHPTMEDQYGNVDEDAYQMLWDRLDAPTDAIYELDEEQLWGDVLAALNLA